MSKSKLLNFSEAIQCPGLDIIERLMIMVHMDLCYDYHCIAFLSIVRIVAEMNVS